MGSPKSRWPGDGLLAKEASHRWGAGLGADAQPRQLDTTSFSHGARRGDAMIMATADSIGNASRFDT
jgi:hypothetical protein